MYECSFTDFTNLQTFKKPAWPHMWKKLRIPSDPLLFEDNQGAGARFVQDA